MRPQQPYIRQLRIELATRSDIVRFLNAAVRLAKIMGAELEAVFLQDQEMLDAAALPIVQEVCLWTAQEQHTSTTLLSRSMRIQAKQTQTLLAEIAGREAVPCSYVFEQNQLVEPVGVLQPEHEPDCTTHAVSDVRERVDTKVRGHPDHVCDVGIDCVAIILGPTRIASASRIHRDVAAARIKTLERHRPVVVT